MSRIHLLATGTMLMFALTVPAQQTATKSGGTAKGSSGDVAGGAHGVSVPTAEEQLKVLTEKLDLTGDQQAKVRPILQELQDATQKFKQDKSMSREELLDKVRPLRVKADKRIREILNNEQKKKLDQYLQGPHPEMHGNLSGATPPSTTPPPR
jgi:Spy/CpxP family protein refolding chaperone